MTVTSIEDLLRPYAKHPCPGPGPNATSHELDCLGGCHSTGLDPRFDPLRGQHVWGYNMTPTCVNCGSSDMDAYCPHTDLGSIYDVAAACGFKFLNMTTRADGRWLCEFFGDDPDGYPPFGEGETKEEAAAGALAAAVPLTPKDA